MPVFAPKTGMLSPTFHACVVNITFTLVEESDKLMWAGSNWSVIFQKRETWKLFKLKWVDEHYYVVRLEILLILYLES